MKITRQVNGESVEFELTPDERVSAYYEQQEENDRSDMELYIEDGWEDSKGQFESIFDVKYDYAMKHIAELGKRLRVCIEELGMAWEDARYEAIMTWKWQ